MLSLPFYKDKENESMYINCLSYKHLKLRWCPLWHTLSLETRVAVSHSLRSWVMPSCVSDLPLWKNSIRIISQRCAQRLISRVIADLIKITVDNDRHTSVIRPPSKKAAGGGGKGGDGSNKPTIHSIKMTQAHSILYFLLFTWKPIVQFVAIISWTVIPRQSVLGLISFELTILSYTFRHLDLWFSPLIQ